MLCEAVGRKLTAEERFAVLALTADPSLLSADHTLSPTCEFVFVNGILSITPLHIYTSFIKRLLDLYSLFTV